MRIRPSEFETSICDVKYQVSLHSRCRYSDLQDVCMAIESLTNLDLPMVIDSIGIYELKGPYYTLTMTDWFLQALSVIPRGSWGDVARRFTMVRWVSLDVACWISLDIPYWISLDIFSIALSPLLSACVKSDLLQLRPAHSILSLES
ncbi:phosphoribosylamine--glycine ligase-like [Dorcoceras hygrometricum]|uniref:Phosphoribosylamine--glycine ligase-like n=1 Tax=Dorcoceras hygrometricum TaxID=472368 RepID=A0A2Z7CLV6_9LAMI|nr:phosphoribosylamine--glycine ligase-like [Dorcoceras hygrometricum]